MNFQDRTVVITGGTNGMGAAAAKLFNVLGANVYVLDINRPVKPHNKITYLHCDVSSFNEVNKNIQQILKSEGRIDHLFTNAGILLSAKLVDSSIEDIERINAINIMGVIYTLKAVLPIMIKNAFGTIVLMGSDQSIIGKMNNSIYGSTKAAVAQLAKSLTVEYAEHNIRINCVCPGTIDTPFCKNAIHSYSQKTMIPEESIVKELENAQPIKRMGKPEEVANLVAFLSSDLASYITGALIPIDGGYTAQ